MTMTFKTLLAFAVSLGFAGSALAEGDAHSTEAKHPEELVWSWDGPLGTFDRQQLQRGYQVYKEVCAACHAMHLISFRNLSQKGGPEFTDAQMKAIAASFQVPTINDNGEPAMRPGTAADRFPSPYPNEKAARA